MQSIGNTEKLVKQYLKFAHNKKRQKAIIQHYEQLIFSDESEQYDNIVDDLSWQNGIVLIQHDGWNETEEWCNLDDKELCFE